MREHLGIHAFGVNAYTPGEDGTLISDHDESGSGQEELYVVLDGNATFEVDGETFDAPAGTLVSVRPESRRKATGEGTVLALGAKPGEAYEGLDWGELDFVADLAPARAMAAAWQARAAATQRA